MSGIGIGLLALGLASGVASTALDYWYYFSLIIHGETANAYFGLWEFCVQTTKDNACKSWNSLDDQSGGVLDTFWLKICEASMIIAVVWNALTCVGAIIKMPRRNTNWFAFCGGVQYLIAAGIFFTQYEHYVSDGQTGGHLHAGFGLAIVAGLMNLISICVLASAQAQT